MEKDTWEKKEDRKGGEMGECEGREKKVESRRVFEREMEKKRKEEGRI